MRRRDRDRGSAAREGELRDRRVPLPFGELPVLEAGVGRPVVLVHGNFASQRWWLEQLRAPPPGLRLLAPTLPNFAGAPQLEPPVQLGTYAQAVHALLDAEGLDRVVLVGHSLGASVAELTAVRAPERVAALLLVDGVPPTGLPRPEEHYRALTAFRFDRSGLDAALRALCPARLPEHWERLLDDAQAMAPHVFEGHARALAELRLPLAPSALDAPVTVLRGARDPLILEHMADATARHWPDARRLTWPEVGHSPQLEAPERFGALLADVGQGGIWTPAAVPAPSPRSPP